ncbi:MAG: type II toxin-antitoxin system RelE/ParE family toxin [Terriglobales bacterium]
MPWAIAFHPACKSEFDDLAPRVQDALLAVLVVLRERGPASGRPEVDTLKGSAFANMKELRFRADRGVWRVAFAFDPQRRGILLVAGNKAGVSEPKFYERLIAKADARFEEHLTHLESKERP